MEITQNISNICDKTLSWLYPPSCVLCGSLQYVYSDETFCPDCKDKIISFDENICEKCGAPAKICDLDDDFLCDLCRLSVFSFERNISLFEYDKYFREIIHSIKYGKNSYYAKKLGAYCAYLINDDKMVVKNYLKAFDFLIPVPIHKNRLRKRGFNQSEVIAAPVAKALNLPVFTDIVRRVKDTSPQSLLESSVSRAENVRGAFWADKDKVKGKAIVVFDDIFTTGSTMESLTRVLLDNGASKVTSLTICGSFVKK